METYDYYLKVNSTYKDVKQIWSTYAVGVKDSKDSLYSVIMVENSNRFITIIDKLENDEKFCASCMYINLDSLRKAMHRYLIIEHELGDIQKKELNNTIDSIHELCMPLNKWYNARTEDCVVVENEDLDKIKAYALINNPEYDDEDEENDY
jgi:hypothetical protein